jgi:hypothetical protein
MRQEMKTPGAGGRTGAGTHERADSNAKPTADKRELQGIVTARQAGQKSPRWDDPPESDAMRLLGASWPEP